MAASLIKRIECARRLKCGLVVHSEKERTAAIRAAKAFGVLMPRVVLRELPEEGDTP